MNEGQILEFFSKLGWMGGPLLLTSVVALALAGERTWFFWRWRGRAGELRKRLREPVERGDITGGVSSIAEMGTPLAPVARVWLEHVEAGSATRKTLSENAFQVWQSRAKGPIKTMGTLAQIAPLLGLTGTVLGLVEAFQVIEKTEGALSPDLLAGGIWEALLTTVFGMFISIPLIILIRIFNGQLESIMREARDLYSWLEACRSAGMLSGGFRREAVRETASAEVER